MEVILILLGVLLAGGIVAWLLQRLMPHHHATAIDGSDTADDVPATACENTTGSGCADTSCAVRPVCPSQQLLQGQCGSGTAPVYYDDEELDEYRGRAADQYTATEEEQWRDVLYTLQPADLLGWGQSVQRRGLVMPTAIRDEFLNLAAEQHPSTMQ